MGLKTRLSSYCTKRANNGVNLVMSRKINTRLARPIKMQSLSYSSGKLTNAQIAYALLYFENIFCYSTNSIAYIESTQSYA